MQHLTQQPSKQRTVQEEQARKMSAPKPQLKLEEYLSVPGPLTPEQQAKMKEFKEWVEALPEAQDPKSKEFLTEITYYRYLRGDGWDLGEAKPKMQRTLKWRLEYQPWAVKKEEVQEILDTHFVYKAGKDKYGRPVVFVVMGHDTLPW